MVQDTKKKKPENILIKNKIKYFKPKDIYKFVAKEIINGKLIGLFQNKMEFGHRALEIGLLLQIQGIEK